MAREIELKEGQGIGLVYKDSVTGEIGVKPAVISAILGDSLMVDEGGFGSGPYKSVQIALPKLENEIVQAVNIELKRAEKRREKMND